MTIRLNSVVHLLAFLPGLIAIILEALPQAPFPVPAVLPWALALVSFICVYASNYISSIFTPPTPPAAPEAAPPHG